MAVDQVLDNPDYWTRDLGGSASTASLVDTSVRLFVVSLNHQLSNPSYVYRDTATTDFERPILALTLCWVEGFVIGGLLIYWLFV